MRSLFRGLVASLARNSALSVAARAIAPDQGSEEDGGFVRWN